MNNNRGFLVETKSGKGRTKHNDPIINNKVIIYLNNGKKILGSEENIKIIGFID